jgi:hypothetical protein
MFNVCVDQQTLVIPNGTNCAPLLIDLFRYLYETDIIDGASQEQRKEDSLML